MEQSQWNVLIVQRILPPYRLGFFKALSRSERLQATVACGEASKASGLESILTTHDVRVEQVKNHYFGKNETLVIQQGIFGKVRSKNFDVIIVEFNPRIVTNLLIFFYSKLCGIPLIWWGHGIRPRERFQSLYTYFSKAAAANIFYSQSGADKLISLGVPAERAIVAWNSIETEEIDALIQDYVPSQRTDILYVGRLIPAKKTELLVRSYAKAVKEMDLEANLTIVGEGSARAKLEGLIAEFGIGDRVHLVGSAYQQSDLAPYFNRSRLSVSPGYIGLSAIHSMAYGLPMLVADAEPHSPEIAAIKDNVNALFFQADDIEHCARMLTQLYRDEAGLVRMSEAARRTVREQFSVKAMVSAFEQAIDQASKRKPLKGSREETG